MSNLLIPFLGTSIWFIAKILVIFAISLYVIFSVVVVRQVQLMTDTLEVGFEFPIRVLSILHLGFAAFVLLLAFIIL